MELYIDKDHVIPLLFTGGTLIITATGDHRLEAGQQQPGEGEHAWFFAEIDIDDFLVRAMSEGWTPESPKVTLRWSILSLREVADELGMAYSTLAQAAREQRLVTWFESRRKVTTWEEVETAIKAGRLRPGMKKYKPGKVGLEETMDNL